jgi:alcohol dehydrogenase YqhD (iron-dependent ADH family)
MNDFTYYTPTKVAFGRGAQEKLGALLREQQCRKVLLHYGGGSAERSGLLGRVRETLEAEGIAWVELGGVVPNPLVSTAREMAKAALAFKADFILGVGGGSVLDTAKAVAHTATNSGFAATVSTWALTVILFCSVPVTIP